MTHLGIVSLTNQRYPIIACFTDGHKLFLVDVLGGHGSSSDSSSGEGSGSEEEEDASEDDEGEMNIQDETQTNTLALRRTIYLTIMSSLSFEECAHKMLQMTIKPGQEVRVYVSSIIFVY